MKKAAEQLDVIYKAGLTIIITALLFWGLYSIPWVYQHARLYILVLSIISYASCSVIIIIACIKFVIFYSKRI